VLHRKRCHLHRTHRCVSLGGQFQESHVKPLLRPRRSGKEHLHRLADAHLHAGRSGDRQRPGTPRELAVEDQERQTAEVVAVQVRQQHRVHRIRIDAEPLHRDQRRRAAVDQHRTITRCQ
jgi:hypothetical protein